MDTGHLVILLLLFTLCNANRSKRATATMVADAITSAQAYLGTVKGQRDGYVTSGVDTVQNGNYIAMKVHNNYEDPKSKAKFDEATVCTMAMKDIAGMMGSYDSVMADTTVASEFNAQIIPFCVPPPNPTCDAYSKYRNIDGTCNNLQNPYLGSSFTAQGRYLDPVYNDDFDEPRKAAFLGGDLASARKVSNILFKLPREKLNDHDRSMLLFMVGQFLDHDLVSTPTMTGPDGQRPTCCGDPRVECFDFMTPADDEHFTAGSCHEFTRSSPTTAKPCELGRRQQINQLTHFIDASNVYGSTPELATELRAFVNGKLKVRAGDVPPSGGFCVEPPSCILAGDGRSNELPTLTTMHTLFVREHNKIAEELVQINPHWSGNDELIYQEARKIVGAVFQKIVYEEYVPKQLNQTYLENFDLVPSSSTYDYDPYTDPTVKNIFSTAVFRMGHSQVSETVGLSNETFGVLTEVEMAEQFFKPSLAIDRGTESLQEISRFVTSHCSAKTDGQIVDSLRDHLFRDPAGNSLDLGALNIQRGRDHGLPPYNAWREFAGLPRVNDFTSNPGGLEDQVGFYRPKLIDTYASTEDIDVYIGGLSERPIVGGELGPLFSTLFAMQFRDLKYGDRFFYENTDPVVGFKPAQLRAIKRYSLAKIMCDNFELIEIQPDVFTKESECNPLMLCADLPTLNLRSFKEEAIPVST